MFPVKITHCPCLISKWNEKWKNRVWRMRNKNISFILRQLVLRVCRRSGLSNIRRFTHSVPARVSNSRLLYKKKPLAPVRLSIEKQSTCSLWVKWLPGRKRRETLCCPFKIHQVSLSSSYEGRIVVSAQ